MGVFDFHRSIVNQDSDREGQAAERHHIDGLTEQIKHGKRRQNRQRNGDTNDQRTAPTAEEQQDHERCESGGEEGLVNDAFDGRSDEDRLIGQGNDLEIGRDVGKDSREGSLHLVNYRKRRSFAVAGDRHEDAPLPVGPNNVLLNLITIADMRDIFNVDGCAINVADG
jgi:hypothetical protein